MADMDVGPVLRPPQMIVAAMAMGILAFAAVAVFLVGTGNMSTSPQLAGVLLPILALTAVGMFPVHIVVRRAIVGSARRAVPNGSADSAAMVQLATRFVLLTIVGGAQAEGVCLFGLVVYLVTGVAWGLVVPAVGLLFLTVLFPTRDKFRRFATVVTGEPWDDSLAR